MEQGEKNIIQPGGLSTDTSLSNQPQSTTRFVLNGVNETHEGDKGYIANEESNEPCYEIPEGFIPTGKCYIGNQEHAIFLASPTGNSIIAIVDRECNLYVHVDDTNQTTKLGFRIDKQIDATFRLRRGCERVVYFVTPKPMIYNFEKPEEFQDQITGEWVIDSFSLFKTYKSIPKFDSIQVLNDGGYNRPGKYNVAIQYLDADFNPTEFITVTKGINIYNSDFTNTFRDIRGSSMLTREWRQPTITDKAIRVNLDLASLDKTFPFYRLAFVESSNGDGIINSIKYTSPISTQNDIFTFTGKNFESEGTLEEISAFNSIIDEADNIEQIENKLVLLNTRGKDINFCNLQKYASKITADMVTKEVILNALTDTNPKGPAVEFNEGLGYMPGEIYSFGIVYIFEDNTTSPVYHIPGKSPLIDPSTVYSLGDNVYPMSSFENESDDNRYIDNNLCDSGDYWGRDSEGNILKDEKVRHHRFPLRTDVGIPFITKINTETATTLFKKLQITLTGEIQVPTTCDPEDSGCTPIDAPAFEFRVLYTLDGVQYEFIGEINPALWTDALPNPYPITLTFYSENLIGNILTIDSLEENGEGTFVSGTTTDGVFTSDTSPKGLVYTITPTTEVEEVKEDLYSSKIMGIRFSNIEIPSDADLNGQKIIGYYIVRNERLEEEKTILDSAVLGCTIKNANFVSHGQLMPVVAGTRIKKDILGIINPEFKFNQKKYTAMTKIIQQGTFKKTEALHSRTKIRDVMDGTGYVSGKHKDGESDDDGWTLQIKTRDNVNVFQDKRTFEFEASDWKEIFYLNALEDKIIEDSTGGHPDVFNLACDNKVGIISLSEDFTKPIVNSMPYVYFYKRNANPYYNYRQTAYYKDSKNPQYFVPNEFSSTDVFGGDSYITPLRYTNSIYYDMRFKKRKGKTSVWNYIIAAVLVVIAVVITIFTWGAGTAGSIALVGLAAGLVGAAAALTMSGIKQDAWNRAYSELYDKGLRETIADDYIQYDGDCSNINNNECYGYVKNPEDDEIQWLGDSINLWFESAVNMSLRVGATDNTPDFLNAPGKRELGFVGGDWDREYFDIHSVGLGTKEPTTALDSHMVKKLTFLDDKRKGGKAYVGLALAEIYEINPDYQRPEKQKPFYHLGLEYDCCSDCNETFPHRVHASETAFQEELTDNYRTFLPNNYIDIEGNSGVITDAYRIGDALYIHTEEALWKLVPDIQERITGDIISFIGTGSFFAIPPKKIVDDTHSSAGNRHKWARVKTKYGVLFPSHKEKKWYIFTGEKLEPISDTMMMNYFKETMKLRLEERYFRDNGIQYPYDNNPSNKIGIGYLSVYDSKKERLIITKKDMDITNLPETGDYQLCTEGEEVIIFENINQTIADMEGQGYIYAGIENCRLKFVRTTYTEDIQIRTITVNFPNNADIYAFYDTSDSFNFDQLDTIRVSVRAWFDALVASGHTGSLTHINNSAERWLNYPSLIPPGGSVVVLTFVNESNPVYHELDFDGTINNPTSQYIADYDNFVQAVYPDFDYFAAINYPIHTANLAGSGSGKCFIQHAIAAVYGTDFTPDEADALEVNSAFSASQWITLKNSLANNPYKTVLDPNGNPGLLQYNWQVKTNRNDLGTPETDDCPASSEIISPCQFAIDIDSALADITQQQQVEVVVTTPHTEIQYVEGNSFEPQFVNNGMTMSYSLKDRQWVSWHSYIPDFYLHDQERFYSWKNGLVNLWRHNMKNHYQTFYGEFKPFIIEYVDVNNPLMTKLWDGLLLQTEAKKWDDNVEEFVDQRYVTFNKILVYNTHQISDILEMIVKDDTPDYILNQITNSTNSITIDRNERDWTINDLRDIRVDDTVPMFIKKVEDLQLDYFIDKIVNPAAVDENKDWTQMESFRDKFLVVRLIFDKFDNTRLLMNFSINDSKISER